MSSRPRLLSDRARWRRIAPLALAGPVLIGLALASGCRSFPHLSRGGSSPALDAAPRAVPPGGWKTPVAEDEPLVGRIWDTARGRFLSESALVTQLAGARFVLLGESHDNADHHRLEGLVIRRLVAAGRRHAVAFEMLRPDQEPALQRVLSRPGATPAELRRAVGWDASGWPAWSLYEPVFAAALAARLPIVAANLSERTLARMRGHGIAGLDAATRDRLGLDQPLPPEERTAMAAEIREAHCGYAPEAVIPGMVDVQRARDGAMAAALEAAAARPDADGALLVAGNGHVRRDRGVPWHLRGAGVHAAAIASLAFLEVPLPPQTAGGAAPAPGPPSAEGSPEVRRTAPVTDPARDLEDRVGSARAFDYVWYTPRVDALDPCAEFRQKLERLRRMKLLQRGGGDLDPVVAEKQPPPPHSRAPDDGTGGGP